MKIADDAQQEFSSEQHPSLPIAIPALESLHRKFSDRFESTKPKYIRHREGLAAACDTVMDYYNLTSKSKAYGTAMGNVYTLLFRHTLSLYILSSVLVPSEKLQYFERNWSEDLQRQFLANLKETVRADHLVLSLCRCY